MDPKQMNGLTLAYMGDAIYEVYIREYVISLGYSHVKDLHKLVTKFTSGNSQAELVHYMLSNNLLSEDELLIFKRGRNSHVHTVRKNMELKDYLDATGFEAVMGYLYLSKLNERIEEIVRLSLERGGMLNEKSES